MKRFTKQERYLAVYVVVYTVALLGAVMPAQGQEVRSTKVKLVSVQMPDSPMAKGVRFQMTVSAQVTNADSPKGGITVSFSKPVEIQMTSSSASAKVYPQGSKLWNQQVKANIVSKQPMVELWVEYWPKERIHQLSLDVTPLEAGDLDVFIRATATDATSGVNVNVPKEGVVDQQGFPCEKRTIRIILPKPPSAEIKDWIKKLEDPEESIQQQAEGQLADIIWQKSELENRSRWGKEEEADILLSDIDGNGTREIIASFNLERGGYIAVVDETLSTIQVIDVRDNCTVKTTDLFGGGKQALIIQERVCLLLLPSTLLK